MPFFRNINIFLLSRGPSFSDNYWLYNIFLILIFSFYVYYFRAFIINKIHRLILQVLALGFIFSSILYFIFTDVYFTAFSPYTMILGTILLFLSVVLFYFELLRSDIMLKLKFFLPLYISIGALIFYLCVTPIDLFSRYFSKENSIFVNLRVTILLGANIFMYLTFIIGFLVCSEKKMYN